MSFRLQSTYFVENVFDFVNFLETASRLLGHRQASGYYLGLILPYRRVFKRFLQFAETEIRHLGSQNGSQHRLPASGCRSGSNTTQSSRVFRGFLQFLVTEGRHLASQNKPIQVLQLSRNRMSSSSIPKWHRTSTLTNTCRSGFNVRLLFYCEFRN